MDKLSAAFDLFRRGMFIEARDRAGEIIDDEPQHFWAHYLAAVSSAFAPDLPDFERRLQALDEFEVRNVYLHYLKAYYALLQRDIEKALWNYLEIADDPEGWLARSLIKKFRKVKELKNVEFRVADFIVLPGELPPPTTLRTPARSSAKVKPLSKPETERNSAPPSEVKGKGRGWQFSADLKKRRHASFRLPYRMVFLVASLLFVAVAVFLVIRLNLKERKTAQVPDLQIADSAAVMPVVGDDKILFRYKNREQVINDFERAKQLIGARKVNQARYLLNRLMHSNADFQSREKSRIFIGFIADPEFSDFNDNLPLKELFDNVKLRRGSLIVAAGELRDTVEDANGITYQFIAREGGEEYRVHAFRPLSIKEEIASGKGAQKSIQVYGRFKGLVGQQQAIYIEALRVWK